MPAIETLPLVPSPTAGPATLTTKKITATGDEFEQAMTDALAPDGKISAENIKSKLNFLTTTKRPLIQSASAAASPQISPTEQSAGEKVSSPGEAKKLFVPSAKTEKAEPAPALLISPADAVLAPMISFSTSAPGNFFTTPTPMPATGGKTAAPPSAAAITGVVGKSVATPLATMQKVSPEISSQPQAPVKTSDLIPTPAAPTSDILTPIAASASTQTATPVALPTTNPMATQQNFAPSPAANSNPQPGMEPASAVAQTLAPAVEILTSDSAVAVPLNFQPVADTSVATPQPGNVTTTKVVANDPQKISAQLGPVIQSSARKPETVRGNSEFAVSANIQTNSQTTIQVTSLPEKNLADVLTPTVADETTRAEKLPAQLIEVATAPKMNSGDLPSQVVGRGELRVENSSQVSAASANTGTGVASTPSVMKKSDKVEFFAGAAGQKLPVAGPTRVATESSPLILPDLPPRRSELFSSEFSAPFSGSGTANNFTAATSTPLVSVASLPSPSEARLQTVERTHDLVSTHALRLVESKSDSMSVVLKPGAGMELSLELRQRNGVVEAQAFLSQGDHQLLNQHWADLQSRLELRGVKLGPLGGEESFTSSGNFSQQRSPSRDEETERAAAFAEFAAVSGGATARSAAGAWGWESWA